MTEKTKKMAPKNNANKMMKGRDAQAIKNINIDEDTIEIEFLQPSNTGYTYYRYDNTNPGKEQVKMMKKMAKEGKLIDYIEQEVRKMYASRW